MARSNPVVPKKTRITLVKNKNDELIPTRISSGWRMCVDYGKLNLSTRKDHFPLPFMGIVDTIRLLLILRIKKRLYLHVHLVHMHIGECLLVSVMLLQLFKDA